MAGTEGWTQPPTTLSHFERIYKQLKAAYLDDINEKDKLIQHLESKLKEKDLKIKELRSELNAASQRHQDAVTQLNDARKDLVKCETEAKYWREKAEDPCEKCGSLREQVDMMREVVSSLTAEKKRKGRSSRYQEESESQFTEDANRTPVRRSPRKPSKSASSSAVNKLTEPSKRLEYIVNEAKELTEKSPAKKALSQSQGSKKSSRSSRNSSQKSSKNEELKEVSNKDDVISIPSDSSKGTISEDDTSPASKTKHSKLKSNKRGRTRYKEESVSETKRPRLSPGKNFVEPLSPRDTRTTRRNKWVVDSEFQATKPDVTVLAADTEVLPPIVPKRSSSRGSDKSTEFPNIVIPETVPHDFTVIDSDDDDNDDKHVTVKEAKPERTQDMKERTEGRPKDGEKAEQEEQNPNELQNQRGGGKTDDPKKLNIRSISTDEESTSHERDSPVFGNSTSRPRLKMPKALSRSLSSKKSAESPCLFDEEDGDKNGENSLNVSYEGLNIKRKNSKRQTPKSKSPASGKSDSSKTKTVLNESEHRSSDPKHRTALKQLDNLIDPDESKSPSVLSGKLAHVQTVTDPNETKSPSVLTGAVKTFATENGDKPEQWLNSTPNRKSRLLDLLEKPLDIEDATEEDTSSMQRTRLRRKKKKSLVGESSPQIGNGKKLVQCKITEGFFKKQKFDLSSEPDFNGVNLNNSFASDNPLTPEQREELEIQEAIKRSMEEVGGQGHLRSQGHADVKSQVMDVGSFSQMTGPVFTSTPCVSNAKKNDCDKKANPEELFKKPPIPTKQAKTPKRNKLISEHDSPRRSPRLKKNSTSSSESSSDDERNRRSRSKSRKQLDLEPYSEGQRSGNGQITLPVSSDLNGSVDPNIRFSEYDGEESHLLLRSRASSNSSNADVFHGTGAFNITDSGQNGGASLKSDALSRTGLYHDESGMAANDHMNSPDDVTGSPLVAKSGHFLEEEESEMKVIEDGEDAYQEPVSLLEMQDDVRSVPMNDFLSQNPRSRATRVTPPNKSKVRQVQEVLEESDDDDDDDDLECTGTSVVFGKKASPRKNRQRDVLFEDSFDRVPKKKAGPDYKYHEVVRKRHERQKLEAYTCYQCEEYFGNMGLSEEEFRERMAGCRHRAIAKPPDTPEHYWEIDFPDTQQCEERGMLNKTQVKPGRRRKKQLRKLFKTEKEEKEESQSDR